MTFLQEDYKLPKSKSLYMKFEDKINKFRVVSSAITGYEYWNLEGKPVRLKEEPKEIPQDIQRNEDGTVKEVAHFWAFAVLQRILDEKGNVESSVVKILEIKQKSIQREILDLVSNNEWGDPKNYDITVSKTGKGKDTRYTLQPSPHKVLTKTDMKLIAEKPVNVEALFGSGDPFEIKQVEQEEEKSKDTNDFDIDAVDDVKIDDVI